jgi:cohesin loading factor subunit SCC2
MESKTNITVSNKISGDQDADATLFGGILTNHAQRLLEMTQFRDEGLRFAALDLIGHLMRQGQVNPNETVPFLLVLKGDVEKDDIHFLALKLLTIEGEKRPDMLRQRVCVLHFQKF